MVNTKAVAIEVFDRVNKTVDDYLGDMKIKSVLLGLETTPNQICGVGE